MRLTALAALVASALLAACGGSAAPPPKPESQGGSVEDQLGFTHRGLATVRPQVEDELATCMKAEGFEYVPIPVAPTQAAGRPDLSDEEFDKLFGYGISTLPPDAAAADDPNTRIRGRLASAELRAYHEALTGGRPELTFYEAVDSGEFTDIGGCTKRAAESAFKVASTLLVTLQRALDELDESIAADPRMVRADERWSRCMLDVAGKSYEDSDAVEDDIRARLQELSERSDATGNGSLDAAALKRLQRLEIEFAHEDNACDRKHLLPVEDVVRAEFEAAFRERHADLLRMVPPLGG
ncbi:MAG: hypothetical protein ACR2H2_09895 [Solirubrobacteraceae bacterium]